MGEPAIPSDRERDARRAIAQAIVEAVRNDEAWPPEFCDTITVFGLAQEIVMLMDDEHERIHRIGDQLPALIARNGTVTMETNEIRRVYELGVSHGLERVAVAPAGAPTIAAVMKRTTKVVEKTGDAPATAANVGDLVFVELPPNCSIHALPGYGPDDLARIVTSAITVGEHWDNQDGINAAYLDELAEATRARRGG